MLKRTRQAISKFQFCLDVTGDFLSFIKLLWFTKEYAWLKNTRQVATEERPVDYHMQFNHLHQPVYLRTFAGDIDIFYEMFWHKVYELPAPVMREAKTIVDLGSNTGMSALFFLDRCPLANIICLEPETGNFKMLRKNLELQILKGRVTPLQLAIDDHDGTGSMLPSSLKYNSRLVPGETNAEKVRTTSMNSLVNDSGLKRIDILKMDIEGTETRIFSSDTSWLDKVKNIVIEFHSAEGRRLCLEVLVSKGFSMFPILRGNSEIGYLFWGSRLQPADQAWQVVKP
jgi:FkbM family methyltransferase